MHAPPPEAIAQAILDLTAARGPDKSICPSEVARAPSNDTQPDDTRPDDTRPDGWRALMAPVRRVAAELAMAQRIDILRHGRPIDPAAVRGVIRLRSRP